MPDARCAPRATCHVPRGHSAHDLDIKPLSAHTIARCLVAIFHETSCASIFNLFASRRFATPAGDTSVRCLRPLPNSSPSIRTGLSRASHQELRGKIPPAFVRSRSYSATDPGRVSPVRLASELFHDMDIDPAGADGDAHRNRCQQDPQPGKCHTGCGRIERADGVSR